MEIFANNIGSTWNVRQCKYSFSRCLFIPLSSLLPLHVTCQDINGSNSDAWVTTRRTLMTKHQDRNDMRWFPF